MPQILGLTVILEVEDGDPCGIERELRRLRGPLPTSAGEHESQHAAHRQNVGRDSDLLDTRPRLATLFPVEVGQHQNGRYHADPDGQADVGDDRRQAVPADQPILELQHSPADRQINTEDLRNPSSQKILDYVGSHLDLTRKDRLASHSQTLRALQDGPPTS